MLSLHVNFKLFHPSSTSVWNNFISARGNLSETISELFHMSTAAQKYISNMFNAAEIILNNLRTYAAAEIILFQFQMWLHVK